MQPEFQPQRFFAERYPSSDSAAQTTSGCHDQASRGLLPFHFLSQVRERVWASRYLISYTLLAALFLSFWHSRATNRLSPRAFAVFVALCAFSLIYGRFFIKVAPLSCKVISSFSLQFVCGYLVINTFLFLLSLFTPFGIAINVSLVIGGGLLILLFSPENAKHSSKPADYLPDFLCLLLSGIAATLWCTDALRPVVREGSLTIYQTIHDSFFHSRLISSFAQAHGLKTVFTIAMSGQPTPLYHYAIYITPAAISFFTNTSAYITFVSFLVPFGILLSGLAAFSLVSSVCGNWPAVAATLAVTLLPDAYQQGLGNKWLSYYFFQQAAPGGLYGVACVAIAWMFILNGCNVSRLGSILFGYAVLVISIVYKAHFFVANAFLLMIYPCVFFRGLRVRWRLLSAVVLVSLFCFVISLSQNVQRIPTVRLDGSTLTTYARFVMTTLEPRLLTSLYQKFLELCQTFPAEKQVSMSFAFYAAGILLLYTFGIWTAIYLLTWLLLRRRIAAAAALFPFLVIVNYIVMSLGLAMDSKEVARPEELLHRPFVWAYFVVAAWSAAGAYILLFGPGPPASKFARILATVIGISSIWTPLAWAHNFQTLPFPTYRSYKAMNPVPTGLVKACSYIRENSHPQDLVQDSENDPRLWVTGLTDRQDFAADFRPWKKIPLPELDQRLRGLAGFKNMTNDTDVTEFARRNKISWYILRPESKVAWPSSVLNTPVFRAGDYRVYHFIP
jgi:hypothetical protein